MPETRRDVIVVGASVGGVEALLALARQLPAGLQAAVFVAIHMAPTRSKLPELVSARGPLPASHPVDGEPYEHGRIYIAPPDMHLQLRGARVSVARGVKENGNRPSVDTLFRSAAQACGQRVIGVVLSGNLDCGTAGLLSIKARGGLALAQDPAEAKAPSMPASAARNVALDHTFRLAELGSLLARLTREPVPAAHRDPSSALLALEGAQTGKPAPMVCPSCQGVLTESQIGSFSSFRCHVGHVFSLSAAVMAQAESVERALWSAVRALEEAAAMTQRLAHRFMGETRRRFEEKALDQRQQADTIKRLLTSPGSLSVNDAEALLASAPATHD